MAVDVDDAKLEAALRARRDARGALGRRRRRRPPSAVREASGGGVDYAIEATGRPEAALAAFLSTRARGAAVLIGIPRADASITLPALPIPRMERRVLGSIYGSARPERDFPALLELYRRGRLPLDRLVSQRLPLDDDRARRSTLLRGGRRCASVLDLDGGGDDATWRSTAAIGEAWSGEVPNGSHINVVLARRGSPTAAAAAGGAGRAAAGARAVPRLPGAGRRRAAGDDRR